MAFVIDASATLPWRFADEATPWTEALLDRVEAGEDALVPAHWPIEIINSLLMAQRRGPVTEAQASPGGRGVGAGGRPGILGFAQQHHLTAYDRAFGLGAAHRHAATATCAKGRPRLWGPPAQRLNNQLRRVN
jgi:hypothetical protein